MLKNSEVLKYYWTPKLQSSEIMIYLYGLDFNLPATKPHFVITKVFWKDLNCG